MSDYCVVGRELGTEKMTKIELVPGILKLQAGESWPSPSMDNAVLRDTKTLVIRSKTS